MRDLVNNIGAVTAIAPAVLTATTNGTGIDLLPCNSVAVVITSGALVGSAVFVPKLQESDDNAAWTDVAAADLHGAFPAQLAATATVKVGYKGTKRYIRPVLTLSSGTSLAASVVVIRGDNLKRPVA
jgi:hypothetical protein